MISCFPAVWWALPRDGWAIDSTMQPKPEANGQADRPWRPLGRFGSPGYYWRKAREWGFRLGYDRARAARIEAEKFAELGFDRERALVELDGILRDAGKPPFRDAGGMASVHWLLFACLRNEWAPRRILEIGTYDGETAALLSRLFPASEIATVDLPESDPILRQTYNREGEAGIAKFLEAQVRNTSAANITLHKVNSFFVPMTVRGLFDLTWVDGGHLTAVQL